MFLADITPEMLKLCRDTKVKVFFLELVYAFNFNLSEFSAAILEKGLQFVYVIAWARGQLRINFTSIFKVFKKLPQSRSDKGNLENFENTSTINP